MIFIISGSWRRPRSPAEPAVLHRLLRGRTLKVHPQFIMTSAALADVAPTRLLFRHALRRWAHLGLRATMAALAWTRSVEAADTTETFDLGLGEFELYQSFDGLGRPLAEQTRSTDALLGYGVTPRVSLYAAPSFSVDGYLARASLGFELGAFGTPIDTDHFDFDLGIAAATDGAFGSYSDFVELNFDLAPDLELAGLYVRGGLSVTGGEDDAGRSTVSIEPGTTLGAYVTVAGEHQMLAEVDCGWVEGPVGRPEWQHGALHVGYNVQLLDHLEFLHELSFDIPNAGEDWAMGFFFGVIAALPPAR